MADPTTFITPGQRFIQTGLPEWRADLQITIVRVAWDSAGVARVTFRCPNGEVVIGPAANIETAIANGEIVPVVAAGHVGCC